MPAQVAPHILTPSHTHQPPHVPGHPVHPATHHLPLPTVNTKATSGYLRSSEQRTTGSGPATVLRMLERLSALDSLHFALWDLGHRRDCRLARHPAALAVSVAREMLVLQPSARDMIRQHLHQAPAVAKAWGVRSKWLQGGAGLPWYRGGCLLLRLMRARWCEAACLLHGSNTGHPASSASSVLDASDEKVRTKLEAWQFVGRDLAARWMAFVIPSPPTLRLLARHVDVVWLYGSQS